MASIVAKRSYSHGTGALPAELLRRNLISGKRNANHLRYHAGGF